MASQETIERLKDVIRTNLKVEPEQPLDDDMTLIGGEFDLDSLDVLLLVTSIEKEFGMKIPNEAVGKEAFATLRTLAEFVDEQRR